MVLEDQIVLVAVWVFLVVSVCHNVDMCFSGIEGCLLWMDYK